MSFVKMIDKRLGKIKGKEVSIGHVSSRLHHRPRNPQSSGHYHCGELFQDLCSDLWWAFLPTGKILAAYLEKVVYRYLDCGDLHKDFALVKYIKCLNEYLRVFSFKHLNFYPPIIRSRFWNSWSSYFAYQILSCTWTNQVRQWHGL